MAELSDTVALAGCRVDLDGRRVHLPDGSSRRLTPTEARLLAALVDEGGRPVSRDDLHLAVWGEDSGTQPRVVDFAVRRLRAKVELSPADPASLLTVYGVGYRVALEAGAAPAEPDDRAAPPTASGPLLGRSDDLQRLRRAFADGARLVTLLGPGGVGKTRLAQELAGSFEPAAVWVDLQEAWSGSELLAAIATGLGCRADPSAVTTRLEGLERGLLVLDNLEQIPQAGVQIEALLQGARELRVLATSRVVLDAPSERCVELGPLSRSAALELYLGQASRRRAAMDAQERAAAAVLVDQLDRLPLALKLAAARSRLMGPGELSRRLRERSDLLGSDDAGRHGALGACVRWSWELLEDEDRQLLSACAVFRGGFDLTAAVSIIGADEAALADGLTRLRDRSLLTGETGERGVRLGMLFGIAAFAREQLAERGDADAIAQRHARWYADEGDRREANLRGPDYLAVAAWFDRETANFDAAARWALDRGETPLAGRLLLAPGTRRLAVGGERGWWDRIDRCIAALPPVDPLRARLLHLRGAGKRQRGAMQEALLDFDEALPAAAPEFRNRLLRAIGVSRMDLGRADGHPLLQEVLATEPPGSRLAGRTLFTLGFVALREGDLETARDHAHRAEDIARTLQDVVEEVYLLNSFCRLSEDRGALVYRLDRCIELATRLGMVRIAGDATLSRAEQAALEGRTDDALDQLGDARRLLRRCADRYGLAWATDIEARAHLEAGRPADAERAALRAEAGFVRTGIAWAARRTAALRALAMVLQGREDQASGVEWSASSDVPPIEQTARIALLQGLLHLPDAPADALAAFLEAADACRRASRPAEQGRMLGLAAAVGERLADERVEGWRSTAAQAAARWADVDGAAALAVLSGETSERPSCGAALIARRVIEGRPG